MTQQAGAEIEITPKMIEAGVDAALSYTEEELTQDGRALRDAVAAIYSAMKSRSD